MGPEGLEPSPPYGERILSAARLPIPPWSRAGILSPGGGAGDQCLVAVIQAARIHVDVALAGLGPPVAEPGRDLQRRPTGHAHTSAAGVP